MTRSRPSALWTCQPSKTQILSLRLASLFLHQIKRLPVLLRSHMDVQGRGCSRWEMRSSEEMHNGMKAQLHAFLWGQSLPGEHKAKVHCHRLKDIA